jgi:cytoskeletal protein CcmA (bactofilin family)
MLDYLIEFLDGRRNWCEGDYTGPSGMRRLAHVMSGVCGRRRFKGDVTIGESNHVDLRDAEEPVSVTFCCCDFAFFYIADPPLPSADWTEAETFVWSKLRQGQPAILDENCTIGAPSPKDTTHQGWSDPCRILHASFLYDLLSNSRWQEAIPHQGIRIARARIVGDLDLANVKLVRTLRISGSLVDGTFILTSAHADRLIGLTGTLLRGNFVAGELHSESGLLLGSGTTISGNVDLREIRVSSQIALDGLTVQGKLAGDGMIAAALLMRSATFQDVSVTGATISGPVELTDSKVNGEFSGEALHARHLLMRKTSFVNLRLRSAGISGEVQLEGATVSGFLDGHFLQAEMISMRSGANKSIFNKINLGFARIATSLDISGSEIASLDLSGASVNGDFRMSNRGGELKAGTDDTRSLNQLTLRGTHVHSLADGVAAWPTAGNLILDGFTFNRLGGADTETAEQLARPGGMKWWDEWARRDPYYRPNTYAQLATALLSAGHHDAADDIRYFDRVRQRETERLGSWVVSGVLQYVAGFGIGTYTFRVLYWIVGITLALALYLWCFVADARTYNHGILWCIGASLSRLVPVIEINREFSEFFYDPERERLTGFQSALFSCAGVIGWFLGGVLVVAVTGLTHNP